MAFTYPNWAKALAEAGVLASLDVYKAADMMHEAEEDGKGFEKTLRCVGIY